MYRRRPRRRGETLHPVEVTLALPQTKMLSKAFITADFQAPDAIRRDGEDAAGTSLGLL